MHATALDTTDVARLTAAQIERNSTLWMMHSTSDKTDIRYRYIMMHRWAYDHVRLHIERRVAENGPDASLFPRWSQWAHARERLVRLQGE